ncbi:hypothetical protein FH972_015456 [Carpinus fangiana]|uniref:Allergen Car b I n=1 Tax=Carpinus fangiana TaxID=176857 RepID=A0A5N6RD47_9ROSI|nr:hypothetical protein FH972_015456 [Carpinus fangiana]
MGVITYTDEYTSPIPPARLFKALVVDAHIPIRAVKSIEIIQGDGGAGSIRIDELNEKAYSYKYRVIEGDAMADKLELIVHEVQFEATAEGGSEKKMTTKYHTKGDIVIKEDEIKAGKEKVLASLFTYVKHGIDSLDNERFMCKHTLIEGDALMEKLEYISYELKFEGYGRGGCVCKMRSEYKAKEGIEIKEEDIELGKDRAIGILCMKLWRPTSWLTLLPILEKLL